jgi:hypothetical protein
VNDKDKDEYEKAREEDFEKQVDVPDKKHRLRVI